MKVLSQLYSDQATRFLRDVVGSLQFEAAHPLLQQALVMVGTIPESGQDAELVSCIMSKLAWLLRRTGRLDEATDMGRQALRHSQQASAVGVVETAVCHANLGVLLRQQGELNESLECYHRATAMHKQLNTGITMEMAAMLQNQALAESENSEEEKALVTAKQAVRVSDTVLGNDSPQTWMAMRNLAVILHQSDRLKESAEMFSQAVALMLSKKPAPSRLLAEVLIGWGGNCLALGELLEAKQLFEASLAHALREGAASADQAQLKFLEETIDSLSDMVATGNVTGNTTTAAGNALLKGRGTRGERKLGTTTPDYKLLSSLKLSKKETSESLKRNERNLVQIARNQPGTFFSWPAPEPVMAKTLSA